MNNATSLVNDIIAQAIELGASDIHVEPHRDNLVVRYRVDGLLREGISVEKSIHSAATSRIKVMVDLDIAEQRLPQDGRVHIRAKGKDFDLRVSIIPTIHGEKAVIRLLNKNMILLKLEELGMSAEELKNYRRLTEKAGGMIIVTGPTGCGKTTTLYATLNRIRSQQLNIVTIEDPVEYEIAGINQMHVNTKSGLTFSRGIRAMLRQDPDVIMIGEIRDEETARVAVQAALTGHLVLTTMHTNDAATAVSRLMDLGIEHYLVNASLSGVLAQRLVRLICESCEGKKCEKCGGTGFKGRTAIFELMAISDSMREFIAKEPAASAIRNHAIKLGMKTMSVNGREKAREGLTTIQEVCRSIHLD